MAPTAFDVFDIPALRVTRDDPVMRVPGMAFVYLNASGRLAQLMVVPPQREDDEGRRPRPTGAALFRGGDRSSRYAPVEPRWPPLTYADTRAPGRGPIRTGPRSARIEAAAYRGRPVSFFVVAPWTTRRSRPYSRRRERSRACCILHGLSRRPRRGGHSRAPQPETRAGRSGGRRAPLRGRDRPEPRFLGNRERPYGYGGRAEDVSQRHRRRALQRVPRGHVLSCAGALHPKALSPGARLVEPAARGRWRDWMVGRDVLLGVAGAAFTQVVWCVFEWEVWERFGAAIRPTSNCWSRRRQWPVGGGL
jgi:hypothetical protein